MILLTGATGFVGGAVLTQLLKQPQIAIRTYGRRAPRVLENGAVHMVGEFDRETDYTAALCGVDIVIHCAAQAHINKNSITHQNEFSQINCNCTFNLARQAAAAGVKRFLFISSIGVNGSNNKKGPFKHDDMVAPWDEYSQSKYEAELALHQLTVETDLEVVIIRPPLIYGANAPGNFGKLIQAVRNERWLPLGAINNQRSFVSLANLVDLILTCIDHPKAANQTFLVSDNRDVSTTELLKLMAGAAGKSPRLLPVPMSWLKLTGKLIGKQAVIDRLCGNLQIDICHTKETLGWQPPISVEEGVRRCFDKDGYIC